jgi:hypothetical protein
MDGASRASRSEKNFRVRGRIDPSMIIRSAWTSYLPPNSSDCLLNSALCLLNSPLNSLFT